MLYMKRVIQGLAAIILASLLAGLMYAHFNREGLSQKVLNLLRQQLSTELKVDRFDMDLLAAFPWIRFDLSDVSLEGKGGTELLHAGELRLTVSLFSALSDEIRFRKLTVSDGEIDIQRLKDGSLSLQVTQPGSGSGSSSTR